MNNLPSDTGTTAALLTENRGDLAATQVNKKRGRGANAKLDGIWTRHHVFCTMAVIMDEFLGGQEAARLFAGPLKLVPELRQIPEIVVGICPWILNATYLNFEGSSGFEKWGLEKSFKSWAANRLWFFCSTARNEHPANRKKGNLNRVYPMFYAVFRNDIVERQIISEERANAFWLSVADICPYRLPWQNQSVLSCEPASHGEPPGEGEPVSESIDSSEVRQ